MPGKIRKFWNFQNKAESSEAELLIYGDIGDLEGWNDVTSKQFAEDLKEAAKDAKVINIRINSPGGSVFAGQAIYSMLRREAGLGKKINVYVDGLAASIASVVAMAGDTIYMPKNAMMMIHKPWSSILGGDAEEMRREADVLDQVEKSLITVYQDKTGLEEEEIKNIISAESWFTAEEAIEKGFADVLEEREIAACLKGEKVLALNGQDIDISKFGSFDPKRFGVEPEQKQPPKPKAKAQNKKIVNTDKKTEEKKMLRELCAKLGVNYDAMIADGKTEEDIQAYCLKKMDDNYREASASEQQRMKDILALGKAYNKNELALDFVQNGKTVAEFKDEILKQYEESPNKPTSAKMNNENIGMSEQDVQKFSMLRLIKAMANPSDRGALKSAGFEFEACNAAAEKYGAPAHGGIILPLDVLRAPIMAATGDINTTLGGTLIPEETRVGSFIELLRNKSFVMNLATKLAGLVGTVNIPNQTAGMAAYWVGEDTAPTSSQPTLSEVALAMKTIAAKCRITRSMMKQTTMDMEVFLKMELAITLALGIDLKALYGDGTSNTPKGIKYLDGVNTQEFATQYQPTHAELVGMETQIALDNADVDSMAYMVDANLRGHAKTTLKASGVAGYLWEPGNQINGRNALVTNQVTKGDAFFGNWADLLIGLWGGLEIIVDPFSDSTKGATLLTAFQDIDIQARHAASFCFGSDDLSGTTGAT